MRNTIGKHSSDVVDDLDTDTLLEFIDEAAEHLDSIERALLAFERTKNPNSLEPARRSLHSLKGSAGYLSLVDIQELCHQSEDLLARNIAEGPSGPAPEHIDLIFDVVSAMRQRSDQIQSCIRGRQRVPASSAATDRVLSRLKQAG